VTSNHAETEDPASNLVDVDLEEAGSDSDDVSQPLRFGVSGIQQQLLRSRREAHVATKGNEEASDNDDWDHIDTELLESVEYAVDADSNEVERTSSDSFPTESQGHAHISPPPQMDGLATFDPFTPVTFSSPLKTAAQPPAKPPAWPPGPLQSGSRKRKLDDEVPAPAQSLSGAAWGATQSDQAPSTSSTSSSFPFQSRAASRDEPVGKRLRPSIWDPPRKKAPAAPSVPKPSPWAHNIPTAYSVPGPRVIPPPPFPWAAPGFGTAWPTASGHPRTFFSD
jgi:hypothetical protein